MKERLFITGGSGYVGAMLVDQFARRDDVEAIITLDKEVETTLTKENQYKNKITFIHANLADDTWQKQVREFAPTVIVHTAWQIREIYGHREISWKWNIDGSDNVFDLSFTLPSVKKLVYFSTVASYGAFPENTTTHFYKETEAFRKTNYLYAEEKRIVEEHLLARYKDAKAKGEHLPQVFIVRPAAITGPRGRVDRIRFGLQSALSGSLKKEKALPYKLVSLLVSWVPVTPKWLRQYIHEDDVADIVALLSFTHVPGEYEVFNISPPGDVVLGPDMARAVGKRTLPIYPWMVRLAFFWVWHLTRGKIPTAEGSWKGYSYPIAVDGSKLTEMYGYHYKYPSKKAFVENVGRYAK